MSTKDPALTDVQVLALIKAHPGFNIYQLNKVVAKEMPKWSRSIGKIQKAVQRLKKKGKIRAQLRIVRGRACQQLHSLV